MSDNELRILDLLTDLEEPSFRALYMGRGEKIIAAGNAIQAGLQKWIRNGWETHSTVWNACLFINTVSLDHNYLVLDLALERHHWKRNYLGRQTALLLYELAEDIPTVCGGKFRAAIKKLGVDIAEIEALGSATKAISSFWKDHKAELKDIRTIAAAHRDHDAIKLLSAIESVDILRLFKLALSLGQAINDLGDASTAIVASTSRIKPPELN